MIKHAAGYNVNYTYPEGLWWLKIAGQKEESRNGNVIVAPGPVINSYTKPWQRFLFDAKRNPNPFFHVAEAVWMLAGSDELKWLLQFNSQMEKYSDDGLTLHGAYGYRWRHHFGKDQIPAVISLLRKDPITRRAVIAMWDPMEDLREGRDLPCNTHIYFRGREDHLDMTVSCRSNDAIWGCYGSNYVHFSFLHEVISRAVGKKQGTLMQFSNNFHIYEHHWDLLKHPATEVSDMYDDLKTIPLFRTADYHPFLDDCLTCVKGGDQFRTETMTKHIHPFLQCYLDREGRGVRVAALPESDYRAAAVYWENRNESK